MATTIDLKADTYTIIGKFGCGFTEVCYSIIAECERRTGQQLKKKFLMYFEDAYEHQIELLKKKLPKGVLSHYEVCL